MASGIPDRTKVGPNERVCPGCGEIVDKYDDPCPVCDRPQTREELKARDVERYSQEWDKAYDKN